MLAANAPRLVALRLVEQAPTGRVGARALERRLLVNLPAEPASPAAAPVADPAPSTPNFGDGRSLNCRLTDRDTASRRRHRCRRREAKGDDHGVRRVFHTGPAPAVVSYPVAAGALF